MPPSDFCYISVATKHLIKKLSENMILVVINSNPKATVLCKKFIQHAQPRPHHRAPFVVAQPVFDADGVGVQPLLDHRGVHVVVVSPALVPSVVGRVDKDAVHLARIHRQQGLKRMQVIALHDQVAVKARIANPLLGLHDQGPERHRKVMVPHKFLALEHQFGHSSPPKIHFPP